MYLNISKLYTAVMSTSQTPEQWTPLPLKGPPLGLPGSPLQSSFDAGKPEATQTTEAWLRLS